MANVPKVAPDSRVYAIGDIHGCFDLMMLLLERIVSDATARSDTRQPVIVFLGDYIDRGDDSRRVLKALSGLSSSDLPHAVFLKGNHEQLLEGFLKDPFENDTWLKHGAGATLSSYGIDWPVRNLPEERQILRDSLSVALRNEAAFLSGLKSSYANGDVVFVHAAVTPLGSHTRDPQHAHIWGHPRFKVSVPIPGRRIVHGHYDGPAPVSLPGRICVDTGAYQSGQLTAVRLDDGEGYITATIRDLWS